LECEAIKTPLDESYYAYIPATVALARLGEESALAELAELRQHRDSRIRAKALKYLTRCWRTEHNLCEETKFAGRASDDFLLAAVRQGLTDSVLDVRKQALKTARYQPDARWFGDLAPLLVDASDPLRALACEAMFACATRDQQSLAALYPYLEYADPEDKENYSVRVHALHTLRFHHGSGETQARLLQLFDRPELGVRRELTGALRFCPDQPGLRQAMLQRLQTGDAGQSSAALFVLAIFNDVSLRATFHQHLRGYTSTHALAGLYGLFPILNQSDRMALEACRLAWRPIPA
jgi:hypothetical protein